jgi:hypothetical protein
MKSGVLLNRGGTAAPLRIEFFAPTFFVAPPNKLKVEESPFTGRTYFVFEKRIVAVAKPEGDSA